MNFLCNIFFPTLLFTAIVHAFNFTTNQPTECENITVTWTGGTPPFFLNIYPAFGSLASVNIPDSFFNNGKGSFSTPFPFNPNSSKIIVAMSDATGFASGGISPIIEIGSDDKGCTVNDPSPPFTWQSNFALQQCRSYTMTIDSNASFPATVSILVPGGTYQNFTASRSSFTINSLDVAAGTSILLTVVDNKGLSGGNSDITNVVQTGDASCLDSTSPSSTIAQSTSTSSSTSSPNSASSVSGGTIGAIVAAILVAVGAIVAFFMFWRKRRQETSRYGRGPRLHVDLDSPALQPVNPGFVPEPFTLQASNHELESYTPSPNSTIGFIGDRGSDQQSQYPQSQHTQSQYVPTQYAQSQYTASQYPQSARQSMAGQSVTTSVAQRSRNSKVAAREQAQRRFVMHTDAADDLPPEDEDEVVELPPQYSENRRPIPGMQPYRSSSSSQATGDSKRPS